MGRGASKAGGNSKGGGSSTKTMPKATNARDINKMNETQLDQEIEKTQAIIDRANSKMGNNDITNNAEAKAMREAFPLGVGGDGWSEQRKKARDRGLERDLNRAKAFTDAYSQKESAETRLKALEKAKKQVKGTNKTVSDIQKEKTKSAVENTPKTLTWKTTQKGGWTSTGGFAPKIIKAGNIEIHGSSGMYTIFKDGVRQGSTDKLSTAKAYAERIKKK